MQQWRPEGFFERLISITPETILVQQKSIWCGIFQLSATETILVFQNGFWCTSNDFGTAEIDLV